MVIKPNLPRKIMAIIQTPPPSIFFRQWSDDIISHRNKTDHHRNNNNFNHPHIPIYSNLPLIDPPPSIPTFTKPVDHAKPPLTPLNMPLSIVMLQCPIRMCNAVEDILRIVAGWLSLLLLLLLVLLVLLLLLEGDDANKGFVVCYCRTDWWLGLLLELLLKLLLELNFVVKRRLRGMGWLW